MKPAIDQLEPRRRTGRTPPGADSPEHKKPAVGYHADSHQKPGPKNHQGDRCDHECYRTTT